MESFIPTRTGTCIAIAIAMATYFALSSVAEDFTASGPCDAMHILNYGPADGGCVKCGKRGGCKICRLVSEERKITLVCWGIKDEAFCVTGPNTPGCEHNEWVCGSSPGDEETCAKPKRMVWTDWIANRHTQTFTRHKLMKRTVTKTVPGFKWVVEDLCPDCQSQCACCVCTDQAVIPLPPTKQ